MEATGDGMERVWLASDGEGLARYREGAWRRWTQAEGLPHPTVRSLARVADAERILSQNEVDALLSAIDSGVQASGPDDAAVAYEALSNMTADRKEAVDAFDVTSMRLLLAHCPVPEVSSDDD